MLILSFSWICQKSLGNKFCFDFLLGFSLTSCYTMALIWVMRTLYDCWEHRSTVSAWKERSCLRLHVHFCTLVDPLRCRADSIFSAILGLQSRVFWGSHQIMGFYDGNSTQVLLFTALASRHICQCSYWFAIFLAHTVCVWKSLCPGIPQEMKDVHS